MADDILKKISIDDMENISLGGAFLGTGGGGDPYIGRLMAEKAIQKGCWILSDETYGMLSFNKSFFSMLNYNYEKLVIISSFSKIIPLRYTRNVRVAVFPGFKLPNDKLLFCTDIFSESETSST